MPNPSKYKLCEITFLSKIKIAVVGLGKIARDQHIPAIAAGTQFELTACVSRHAFVASIPTFQDLSALFKHCPEVQAVALCTPPQIRHALAREVLAEGRHVLLEKPPAVTVAEVDDLRRQATANSLSIFATWHSRFAAAVEPARRWLEGRALRAVNVKWREDVRHWHPGQEWIWQPGGLGVFDAGINALSIVTRLLPRPLALREAELFTPTNREMPIAARLHLSNDQNLAVDLDFDWRQTGPQSWDIDIDSTSGQLRLTHGGARLHIDGVEQQIADQDEYTGIYRQFAALIGARASDADAEPLRLVAAAFSQGRCTSVAAFES